MNVDANIVRNNETYSLYIGKNLVSEMKIEEEEQVANLYFIWDVETKKEYRNNGYSYFLMKSVMDMMYHKNPNATFYLVVSIGNTVAVHLYEKLGFNKCLQLEEEGNQYYCMSTGKGWILNKIISMYKHSFDHVTIL